MATNFKAPPSVHDNDDDQPKKRLTYSQDWANYNLAQVYEREYFMLLASEVIDQFPLPQHRAGRPRHDLTDILKSMIIKVYSGRSTRRSMGDIRAAHMIGYIKRVPHYNTVIEYFSDSELTARLHDLITYTSLPLRNVETSIAIDSTGFSTSVFHRWFDERYGDDSEDEPKTEEQKKAEQERKMREWVKLHATVGEKTQTVISADVLGWTSSDYRQFIPLFSRVHREFRPREILADGAYLGHTNVEMATQLGATPYIPYHANISPPDPLDGSMWSEMYWKFHHRKKDWKARYHNRSKVETAFSSIKRLFGGAVRSKNFVAQVNEVLLKVVAHNIVVLIHEWYELGVYPEFVNSSRFVGAIPDEAIPASVRRYDPAVDRQYRQFGSPDTTVPDGTQVSDVQGWPHHDPTARGLYDGPLSGL